MRKEQIRLGYQVSMMAGDGGEAEIRLWGEVIPNIPSEWKWDAEDKSASDFANEIARVKNEGARKVTLSINSPGGIVSEAIAMRSTLMNAGFDEIRVRVVGLCASAATLLAAIPGVEVEISEGSSYMIHRPMSWVGGNADEIANYAEALRKTEDSIVNIYCQRTGKDAEEIAAMVNAETWMNAAEAVEAGFCDRVIDAGEGRAAALVSREMLAAMRAEYDRVPDGIAVAETREEIDGGETGNESAVENNIHEDDGREEDMDITVERLRAENADVANTIAQEAIMAERQRIDDIDSLTLPGYEDIAAEAKRNGTSAMDFQKQVVAAQKAKGAAYMQKREDELSQQRQIAPGTPRMSGGSDETEQIAWNAAEIGKIAQRYKSNNQTMY
jgi:ATP-dependent protease ClpP protease subunit